MEGVIDTYYIPVKTLDEMSESELLEEVRGITKKFQNDIEHRTLVYEELVEYFHEYMMPLIEYSPLNLYENALSRFIKSQLGNEIPGCFLEEFAYYETDDSFREQMNNLYNYYKDVIDNGCSVSDSEFLELYKLSFADEENSYYYLRYMLGQIIEGNNKVSESTYRSIIKRFVNGFIDINQLNMDFKVRSLEREDYIADSICVGGINYSTFDKAHLCSKDVLSNLEDIFHEVWHTVQSSDEYSEADVVTLMKMDDFIWRVFGDEYYDENYDILSSEVDANLHAVWLVSDFLREVSPRTYNANRERLAKKADIYADLACSRKRTYQGEVYDVDTLFEAALVSEGVKREDILGTDSGEKKLLKEIVFR